MDKLWKVFAVVIILSLLWGWHTTDISKHVKATEVAMQEIYQKKLDASALQAKKETKALQVDKDKAYDELQNKFKASNNKLSNALNELSKRPKRPLSTDNSNNIANTPSACTGAQLYREDGEFLIREAGRAQKVLEERDYYYERYESVRRRLDEIANME